MLVSFLKLNSERLSSLFYRIFSPRTLQPPIKPERHSMNPIRAKMHLFPINPGQIQIPNHSFTLS